MYQILTRLPIHAILNSEKTVISQSATFIGKRRMYMVTDHSGLNKFQGEHDENFQLFLPELKSIVSHAITQHYRGTCYNL